MLKSSLGRHVQSNLSPDEMERLELRLYRDQHKVIVDLWAEENDFVKKHLTTKADNKFKGKR